LIRILANKRRKVSKPLITSTANWTPFFIICLKAADPARVGECDQAGWVYNLAALEFKKGDSG